MKPYTVRRRTMRATIDAVCNGARKIEEVNRHVDAGRSTVWRALAELVDLGLVSTERRGKAILYVPTDASRLSHWLSTRGVFNVPRTD